FIANHPELLTPKDRQDRGTKLLGFLGNISVNGNSDVRDNVAPVKLTSPPIPAFDIHLHYPKGTKDLLTELGPEELCKWLSKEKRIHYTDTTLRDAHQSL